MSPLPHEVSRRLPAFGWTQAIATALARGLARSLFSLEVRGLENLPASGPCLLCSNHSSHVDTFALATATAGLSRRLIFLGAHDYFSQFRWRRWLLRRVICLVDFDRRGTGIAARHNLRMLGACRDDRRIVVLFPEGTRSVDGHIGPLKPGAAMFAERLGVRIVPCCIEGAHEALPKGAWLPRPHPLRVTFGLPQSVPPAPKGETGRERTARRAAFMTELRGQIMQLS